MSSQMLPKATLLLLFGTLFLNTLLALATYHVFKIVNRFIELEPRDNL